MSVPQLIVIPTPERSETGGICFSPFGSRSVECDAHHSITSVLIRRNAWMSGCTYYVHILASMSRVIYVGVTGFLMARVLRHRAGQGGAFTRRYRVDRLVYFQSFHDIGDAIARETELQKWRREKKTALIEERNPTWEDLAEGWGEQAEMRIQPKADSSCLASLARRNDNEPSQPIRSIFKEALSPTQPA